MTNDVDASPSALPPNPVEYDSARAQIARAKGLDAPYIAGGLDPDPEKGLQEDRKYGRWLVIMVVTLVLAGFVLGVILAIATGSPPR